MPPFTFASLHEGAGWVLLGYLLLAGLLYRGISAHDARRRILFNLAGFLGAYALLAAGWYLEHGGYAEQGRLVRYVGVLVEGLSLVSLAALAAYRGIFPALKLHPPMILQELATAALYVIWALVLLRYAGASLAGLITTSAVLTGVIGFAMQDTLGNVLGGIAIQLDHSVRLGDWIKVGDVNGRVVEIGWRSTVVETRNWETLVLPNSVLMKNSFLVLGRRHGEPVQWRRWVWFNVDYRYPPNEVIAAVEREVLRAEIPCVAREPKPNCIMMNFEESYGRYAVRYWLTDLNRDDPTDSLVRVHVYQALRGAGIPPSIPAHAIFLTEESAERKKLKAGQEHERRRAALGRVDLFRSLTPEECDALADRLQPAPFSPGTVLTREGDEAHWLYIVIDGQADVVVGAPGQSKHLSTLGPGQVFGEWGLMTGEPRRASVIARGHGLCMRLDKDAFKEVLARRPELAEEFSRLLAERRMSFDAAMQQLDEEARQRKLAESHSDILGQIKRFFSV
ncbi:MAG: mechanosensitive ion channel family protein [Planctomycetota bacterium]|nr:mechanosensitive ion channel family protein [Planctomycetota bacterium]